MSQRWVAIIVVLAGCNSRREPQAEIEGLVAEAIDRPRRQPVDPGYRTSDPLQLPDLSKSPQSPTLQGPVAVQPPPHVQPRIGPVDPSCVPEADVVYFEAGGAPRACLDTTGDSQPDQCARWRPTGTLLGVAPYAEDELPAPPDEPATFHSDSEHNDDARIELSGGAVQICPYDRVCLKLMPRTDDGELAQVATDAEYRRAAALVRNADSTRADVELWDLDRGRRYAKLPFRGLRRDESYGFSIKLGAGALIALATRTTDGSISGAIYGLDGGYRGALGGGSPTLDASTLETAGLFAVVDPQTDAKPYVLHIVDLASGAPAARFVIPREADTLKLHRVAPGVFAAAQWGKQLRLDVFDVRRGAVRVLRAPAC
jgi:hypothetical protein